LERPRHFPFGANLQSKQPRNGHDYSNAHRLRQAQRAAGQHGLVTEVLRQTLAESDLPCRVVCCGPERMTEAVAKITSSAGVPCLVSLETPMACGIGICFSCVAKVRQGEGWDYRRTCVEGPVFDASSIVF
jgi:dihydroorotate dehydrogenase electron transfer subunit